MKHLQTAVTTALLILWCAALLHWPSQAAQAAHDGLLLSAEVIIPSLFPFFVLASLVVLLGLGARLGRLFSPLMEPVFHVGGAGGAALAVGLIAGYPVGARTVRDLYEAGTLSKNESERLLGFCNNCGPAFLIGAAGSGVFGSTAVGLLLVLCHWLGALSVGVLMGRMAPESHHSRPDLAVIRSVSFSRAFTDAVKSALSSTLNVCAYVVLFSVLLSLLRLSGVLGLCSGLLSRLGLPTADAVVIGMIELSNGVAALQGGSLSLRLITASLILGLGGLSVQCQTLAVLDGSGLSVRYELWGKLLHGLFAALWTWAILGLFPQAVPTLAAVCGGSAAGWGGWLASSFPAAGWGCIGALLVLFYALRHGER